MYVYTSSQISYFISRKISSKVYENFNKPSRSEEDELFVGKIFNIYEGEIYVYTYIHASIELLHSVFWYFTALL